MLPPTRYTLGFVVGLGLILISGPAFVRAQSEHPHLGQTTQPGPKRPHLEELEAKAHIVENYGKLPLAFEANQGQVDDRVKFLSRGAGYELFLTGSEASLVLPQSRPASGNPGAGTSVGSGQSPTKESGSRPDVRAQPAGSTSLRMKLLGANANPGVTGIDELTGKTNYFIGNDPKRWRTNVPTYAKVKYQGVYPGIDLIYYGNQSGHLEYDFIVAPGTDPKVITLFIQGEKDGFGKDDLRASLDSNGDIVLHKSARDIRLQKPIVYQQSADGRRKYEEGRYVLSSEQVGAQQPTISFEVGNYDHSKPLVIDPAIVYSTLLGVTTSQGTAWSGGLGVAVFTDSTAHVYAYIAGETMAPDFPVANAEQAVFGGGSSTEPFVGGDAFITKFDPSASGAASIIYSTYLGGSGADSAGGIAVDSAGNAYIAGSTQSTDFPVVNAYQSAIKFSPGSQDALLSKLSSDGSTLLYSTYFGGSGEDFGFAIALDSAGNAYITGSTLSSDLPTVNPFQSSLQSANGNAFVAAFNTTRSGSASLLYSSYFGGSSNHGPYFGNPGDVAEAIAIDASGAIHLAGFTNSPNLPIINGLQTTALGGGCAPNAAFYAKLNPFGIGAGQLLYSTYLGGCPDNANAVAVDSSGDAYLTGTARSGVFPVTASLGSITNADLGRVFAMKINPSVAGSASLAYSSIFAPADRTPGTFGAGGSGIAVDASGNAFVVGAADPGMPLVNPVQGSANGVVQSINGGQTWTGLTRGLTDFPIDTVAIDTSTSPRTLYAGTSLGTIFSSTDGGLNWNRVFQLPNSPGTGSCGPGSTGGVCVMAIAVDPTKPSNVYAATTGIGGTGGGVYRSSDRGSTWSSFNSGLSATATQQGVLALAFDNGTLYSGAPDGLYVLTPGATAWSLTGLTVDVESIAVDSTTTPHTLFTGSSQIGAYRSRDGGTTWTAINDPDGFISALGVDTRPSPSTLYAFDYVAGYNTGYFIWKTVDAGSHWNPTARVSCCAGPGGVIQIDTTTQPSTIYLGVPNILKSVDGGNSWIQLTGASTGAIAVDPTTANATTGGTLYGATSIPLPNAFVAELNPAGSALLFSTYLGGITSSTGANAIALDGSDNIYVTGATSPSGFSAGGNVSPPPTNAISYFPEVNAFQTAAPLNPNPAAFFTMFGSQILPTSSSGSITTQVGVQTGTLAITLPNISGSTTGTQPTLTVTPLSSATTANFSLSNNLGAYDISTTASYSGSITLCFQALTVNDPTTFNSLQLLHVVNGNLVNITSSRDFATRTVCGSTSSLSPFALVSGIPNVFWNTPSSIVYGTPLSSTQLNATAAVAGSFSYNPPLGSVIGPGMQTLSVTFHPTNTSIYSTVTKTVNINVLYSTGSCDGAPGHAILKPINADGSSVFKLGSTVPTKFRVCDVNGNSVGLPGTVVSYKLIAKGATFGLSVDEQVYSTSADTAFHWDPTGQQWVFNQGTGKSNPTLSQSNTIYVFRINLNDGTYIQFQYGLR